MRFRDSHDSDDLIEIEYSAVETPRGWLPRVVKRAQGGKPHVLASGSYGRGYDRDVAEEMARAIAEEEASRYVGDWTVTVSGAARANPAKKGGRAKAGGEVGLNKEFYPGGTFLPTTKLPKGERPRYTSGSGRRLVAPGVSEVPPLGMGAIYDSIKALVRQRPDGTLQPLPPEHPVWESDMYGSYEEMAAKCAAWNAGERFYELPPRPSRRKNPRRPPRYAPHPSRPFELEASAVQQGLFIPSAYERKPKPEEPEEVDERQADLFGAPPAPAPKRKNPRATYPDGRWVPVLGDEVYQRVRGFMGAGGSILGVVVKGRGGTLRVKPTGYSGMMPATDVVEGKTMALTPAWTVVTDPIHDTKAAAKKHVQSSKEEIKKQAAQAVADYVARKGWKPAVLEKLKPGLSVFKPYSEGMWGTGDPQNVSVEEVVVEEVTPRYFVYSGGATSGPQGWFVSSLRENKANQTFIRRTPSREGSKRNFRYTYDPDLATRVNVKAKLKEKLRIPYNGRLGHYEVVARLHADVVGIAHDEALHYMAITDEALRELARDVYRASPDVPAEADVRHRHEREDALPRSRDDTYRAILQASGIDDYDLAQADTAYRKWKAGKGKRGRPRPAPWKGGQLDAFEADLKRGKHFSSLLEAFEHASRGVRTWRDLEPVLALLRDVPGFEEARFPDEVYERHIQHDAELDEQGHTINVEQYGSSLEANATPEQVGEAVFIALTTIPPGLRKGFSQEDEAQVVDEEIEDWGWA